MWFFCNVFSPLKPITSGQEKCSPLLSITVCTVKCQMKGKRKKEPAAPVE